MLGAVESKQRYDYAAQKRSLVIECTTVTRRTCESRIFTAPSLGVLAASNLLPDPPASAAQGSTALQGIWCSFLLDIYRP
jgi:hypothetical protein